MTKAQKRDEDIIIWQEKWVNVDELRPYEKNPRKISKTAYERLKRDLKADGYHNRMKVNLDNKLIGGHQRLRALTELGITKIPVLVPPELLTYERYLRALIQDNRSAGIDDIDMLANEFPIEMLLDCGISPETLTGIVEPEIAKLDLEPDPSKEKCPECGKAL